MWSACPWAPSRRCTWACATPGLARSLTAAGVGYGAAPGKREQFRSEVEATATRIRAEGMETMGAVYARGPTRLIFEEKDPRGYAEFRTQLMEHSAPGSANTMMGVQRERPALGDLEAQFRELRVPTLVIAGDEDDPTLEPSLFLKRTDPVQRAAGDAQMRAHHEP